MIAQQHVRARDELVEWFWRSTGWFWSLPAIQVALLIGVVVLAGYYIRNEWRIRKNHAKRDTG